MRDRKGQLVLFTGAKAIVGANTKPVLITIVESHPADLFDEATVHDCVLTEMETQRIWLRQILEPIAGWPKKSWQVIEE